MPQNTAQQDYFEDATNAPDIRSQEDAAFLERCKPDLEILEELRLAKLKVYEFRKKIAIPLAILLTPPLAWMDYWFFLLQAGNHQRGAGLSVAFIGMLYWWATQPKRQYAAEYKIKILPQLVKLFGNFQYAIKGCVNLALIQPSKIVPQYDSFDSEDYFFGEYKGVKLEFSELKLKQRRGSGKNRRDVTVFRGIAILIDLKSKKFLGHTIIDQNKGKLAQWFEQKTSKLERANMVDPEFEKIFDVYTNDQVEARWLVDPVMIEKLKGLYLEYNGEKMAAAYYDSKMLVMISSNHNHFEPDDIYTPATDPESILSMKREIGHTLSIIDKLDLYDPRNIKLENNG